MACQKAQEGAEGAEGAGSAAHGTERLAHDVYISEC